jgi:hypothetical protein
MAYMVKALRGERGSNPRQSSRTVLPLLSRLFFEFRCCECQVELHRYNRRGRGFESRRLQAIVGP